MIEVQTKARTAWIQEIYLRVGSNVKKYRKERGYSQVALAHAMGHESVGVVSTAEIWIRGKHFNIEHLAKIAQILDIDICLLFEDVNAVCQRNRLE
ncbi:helix-turn-helix transcriptional regulator [Thiomicrospira sp. R3]|uniref:helix-turn-helix transcriptional regulator n=1 Tax=Thiomicrospira sp. R3 TaxID=3035472 RepID=UPI00259B0147|nr:helix-turn-helix transcriptional regulator [Thiomicrospira sp. R3]WFE68109.1 helix-turn-helix transcriptional regulator [Thiomicrospira sp. R3]